MFTRSLSCGVNVLVIVAAAWPAPALLGGDLFRRGDANGDGRADLSDAVSIFRALFAGGRAPDCLDALDADDSGRLEISDGIYLLDFLFRGGPPVPPPRPGAPCPGADPTPDGLDCRGGADPAAEQPEVDLFAVEANAPGVRQRSRRGLPPDAGGVIRVPQGLSFSLVVEARSNRISRAPFALLDPRDPRAGNPETLEVRASADLGDPAAGGIAAGENLARWFAREVDLWRDEIYLLEHLTLRFAPGAPFAPAPGRYVVTARAADEDCGVSPTASLELEVEERIVADVRVWIEAGDAPRGEPLQHDPGTGNARLAVPAGEWLVVQVLREGAPLDPVELAVTADPAFAAGADLTRRLEPVAGLPGTLAMRLLPPWAPGPGTTRIRVAAGGAAGRTADFRLEVVVDYARSIQPIWTVHCTGCHEQPDPFKGLELVHPDPARTRRNIVNVYASEPVIDSVAPLLVWPYFPERSYLYRKIQGTHLDPEVGGEGAQMPLGGGVLDDATRWLIESWILQGAP